MRALALAMLLALATVACAGAEAQQVDPGAEARVTGDVTVFAAASLTDAFERIARDLEAEHPQARVRFNFAGSQQLATQIVEGAPADVFASANDAQMQVVAGAGAAGAEPRIFAGNLLEIAVEPGNPRGVNGLADLGRADVSVVLAAEQVPAGHYARRVLDAAGVTVRPVSLEADVRAVLTKVSLGEADAGLVYASDVVAAGAAVEGVEIPPDHNVAVAYPAAVLQAAPNPDGAQAFVDLLSSPAGQRALRDAGFTVP